MVNQLKYLVSFVAKGRTYHRVVRGKGAGAYRKTLIETPGTAAFLKEYLRALEESEGRAVPAFGRHNRPNVLTVGDLLSNYRSSADYLALRDTTKKTYAGMLAGFEYEHGNRPASAATADFYRRLFSSTAATPSVAFNLRKRLVAVYRAAEDAGLIAGRDNPLTGIRAARYRAKGLAAWSNADVEAFRAKHGPATVARLAVMLAVETGARRGDLVQLGPHMLVRDPAAGVLGHQFQQTKTSTLVFVPLTRALADALDDARAAGVLGSRTYLQTSFGRPFTANGFGNLIRDAAQAAGVAAPLHGLRKLATTRLLDNGATPAQAMAISGHTSFQEFQKYVGTRDRRALAIDGASTAARVSSNFTIYEPLTTEEQRAEDRRLTQKIADVTEGFRAAVRAKAAQGLALPTGCSHLSVVKGLVVSNDPDFNPQSSNAFLSGFAALRHEKTHAFEGVGFSTSGPDGLTARQPRRGETTSGEDTAAITKIKRQRIRG